MRKIFLLVFLFFILLEQSFAYIKPEIITREQWGANEEYIYEDTAFWKAKFAAWEKAKEAAKNKPKMEPTVYQKKLRAWKKKAEGIWLQNVPSDAKVIEKVSSLHGRPLMWNIKKTKTIGGIIIHHTQTSAKTSLDTIRSIQKFHSHTRAWGDIGYNYLIGTDGRIYEGRKGGETSVGAHTKWNNTGNIGISLMGSYNDTPISQAQYDTLKNLLAYLVEKYDIDMTKKRPFFRECNNLSKCTTPLEVNYLTPIITHRDAGNTTCPGDRLYEQVQQIKKELIEKNNPTAQTEVGKYDSRLSQFSDEKLLDILQQLEAMLDKKYNANVQTLKYILINYFKRKYTKATGNTKNTDVDIQVKLSYPTTKDVLTVFDGEKIHTFSLQEGKLFQEDKEVTEVTIAAKSNVPAVVITSWKRYPAWNTTGKYNDNKFRGSITISLENGKFLVVNTLPLEDYLKGLGEISNNEHTQKASAILISARSYALWYITQARKFPGKPYDASDDPNVFQKYLGYGLEQRSPRLNKIVEETKGKVITYNGTIIKPWYFNSSNGVTKSYYQYCIENGGDPKKCTNQQKKYPFLLSKIDSGSKGKKFNGHGVGLSGNGAEYFAKRGWTYDMILRYFYNEIEVQ